MFRRALFPPEKTAVHNLIFGAGNVEDGSPTPVFVAVVAIQVNGRWVPSAARLYVKVKFMYSKIVPLRNRIYALQDKKRSVEKEMTLIQIGGGGSGGGGS